MFFIIIYIILILFLLYILLNKKLFSSEVIKLSKQLYNGDKWNYYRIGDVYYSDINSDFYDKNSINSIIYHIKKFPNSVASEYLKRNTQKINKNKNLLNKILSEKNYNLPEINNTDLLLHVRIGDIMCYYDDNKKKKYSKFEDDIWWKNVKKQIKDNNVKRIFLFSGAHTPKCLKESAKYLLYIKNIIEHMNIKVIFHIGQDPDKDLVFASKFKYIITTGGGYGKLLSDIIINHGGKLLVKNNIW